MQEFSSTFKYGLVFFLLFCLILAGTIFFNLKSQIGTAVGFNLKYFGLAVIAQATASWLAIIAWKQNLSLHDIKGLSFAECSALMGLQAVGKYAPGKILGSVVRAAAIYNKKTGQFQAIVLASFIEQLAMLHSGVAILALLAANNIFGLPGVSAVVILSILSLFLIRYLKKLIQNISQVFKRPVHFEHIYSPNEIIRYTVVFCLLGSVWLCSRHDTVLLCSGFFKHHWNPILTARP